MAGCLATGRPVRGWDCAEHGGQSTGPGALEGAGGPEQGPDLQGIWAPGLLGHPEGHRHPEGQGFLT